MLNHLATSRTVTKKDHGNSRLTVTVGKHVVTYSWLRGCKFVASCRSFRVHPNNADAPFFVPGPKSMSAKTIVRNRSRPETPR